MVPARFKDNKSAANTPKSNGIIYWNIIKKTKLKNL